MRNGREIARNGREKARNGREKKVYHFVPVLIMFLKAAVARREMSVDSLAVGLGLLKCRTTSTMDENDELQQQIQARLLFAHLI